MRVIALALALALSGAPALAQDAGAPPPPGRAVELEQCPDDEGLRPDAGCVVPFRGSLVDRERMGAIYAKRIAAELERDSLRLSEQEARARQQAAEADRDSRVPWATVLGVGGASLVVGLVAGLVLGLVSWKK